MAISINWLTRVISVPRADMALIQLTPTEVRELNINTFRLTLKDIEDDDGITFQTTHNHYPEVSVGGLVLARVVELLPPYTVTFEDGQYAVNLTGANSNIGDRVNPNQVSIRSFNSAGMTSTPLIEHASFNDGVWIDAVNGITGTIFPAGTSRYPVNNLIHAKEIATLRGFEKLFIKNDFTFGATDDISDYTIIGEGQQFNTITLTSGVVTSGTTFEEMSIQGTQGGETHYHNCELLAISNMHCFVGECAIVGPLTMHPTASDTCHIVNSWNGNVPGTTTIINLNDGQVKIRLTNFNGGLTFRNMTHASGYVSVYMGAGKVKLESTCTAGTLLYRGVGVIDDESAGTTVDITGLTSPRTLSGANWDEAIANHLTAGTTGKALSDAGSAGNPWSSPIDGNTNAGTFGELVGRKLLTVAKFLGLK